MQNEIMKKIKQIAINKGTTQTKIINDYLEESVEREPPENKIHLKILVEDDPNKNMEKLKGIIKTSRQLNAVELITAVRKRE
ncbi:MAG: DUF6364 family protein [Methanobacteriaceae archaeon]